MFDSAAPTQVTPLDPFDRYVSVQEIAPIVGMSVSWLNKHRRDDLKQLSPPFVRINTRCLYNIRACLNWLAARAALQTQGES
jgi:hypothetical protein